MVDLATQGRFLTPELERRLAGLRFRFAHSLDGRLTGVHRSAQPGVSVEFSEHKEYSPGDDLRRLNWKVYARSDKFYVRQFAKDTHANVYLLLDLSGSMQYRSDVAPVGKAFYAARLAAILSYIFLRQNDAVGLLTVQGKRLVDVVPVRSHPSQLVTIQDHLARGLQPVSGRGGHEGPTQLDEALEYLIISRRLSRSALIVLSDLFVEPEALFPYLGYLKSRGNFVWLTQVLDPAEYDLGATRKVRTFPFAGTHLFRSPETGQGLLMEGRLARPDYVNRFERHLQEIQERSAENGIEWSRCNTDADPVEFLLEYLLERK